MREREDSTEGGRDGGRDGGTERVRDRESERVREKAKARERARKGMGHQAPAAPVTVAGEYKYNTKYEYKPQNAGIRILYSPAEPITVALDRRMGKALGAQILALGAAWCHRALAARSLQRVRSGDGENTGMGAL